MSYDAFCSHVRGFAKKAGHSVRFSSENGKHIARLNGGVTITGNTLCRKLTVRWGSGHVAVTSV